jgi:hypothetical protein
MKSEALTFPGDPPVEQRFSRISVLTFCVILALAIWYGSAASFFRPVRLSFAFWFVVTTLLAPMAMFSLGWMCHSIISGTSRYSIPQLLLRHVAVLLLAVVALPLPVCAVNLLPYRHTTSPWEGRVVKVDQLQNDTGTRVGSTATVTSNAFVPHLRLRISNGDYIYFQTIDLQGGDLPPVKGSIVNGFLGFPLDIQLNRTAPEDS